MTAEVDTSTDDSSEDRRVNEFMDKNCGCQVGLEKTRSRYVSKRISRQACLELNRDELDLVVMANVGAQMSVPDQPTQRKSHHSSSASLRAKCEYGVRVCRVTFCFLHRFAEHRLITLTHGNVKRLPSNVISFEEVTTFIQNFARANGMPLPGRVPNHRDR